MADKRIVVEDDTKELFDFVLAHMKAQAPRDLAVTHDYAIRKMIEAWKQLYFPALKWEALPKAQK